MTRDRESGQGREDRYAFLSGVPSNRRLSQCLCSPQVRWPGMTSRCTDRVVRDRDGGGEISPSEDHPWAARLVSLPEPPLSP